MNETYPEEMADLIRSLDPQSNVRRVSMRDISGTDMYCSDDSYSELLQQLEVFPDFFRGIHFIDTGNYHYLSRLFTSHINEKYDLILIDHHNDMQEAAFGGILSCGSWVKEVMEKDAFIRCVYIYGPESAGEARRLEVTANEEKVSEFVIGDDENADNIPVYISVDKDVLDKKECVTNWDQGDLSLEGLKHLLHLAASGRRVIGADICGGLSKSSPDWSDETENLNTSSDLAIYKMLKELIGDDHTA